MAEKHFYRGHTIEKKDGDPAYRVNGVLGTHLILQHVKDTIDIQMWKDRGSAERAAISRDHINKVK